MSMSIVSEGAVPAAVSIFQSLVHDPCERLFRECIWLVGRMCFPEWAARFRECIWLVGRAYSGACARFRECICV